MASSGRFSGRALSKRDLSSSTVSSLAAAHKLRVKVMRKIEMVSQRIVVNASSARSRSGDVELATPDQDTSRWLHPESDDSRLRPVCSRASGHKRRHEERNRSQASPHLTWCAH